MFRIQFTYPDQTTGTLLATPEQKDDFVTLLKDWFDNGLITEWRVYY